MTYKAENNLKIKYEKKILERKYFKKYYKIYGT